MAESVDTRPQTLESPRSEGPDDLQQISGIDPALERALNDLGIYHHDQIAGWSSEELSWVDANLEGVDGRATRDDWVGQAKGLSTQGQTNT